MKSEIEKVSLMVQLQGKAYYVALPQDRLKMLVQLAESLFDDGRLKVLEAGDIYFKGQVGKC